MIQNKQVGLQRDEISRRYDADFDSIFLVILFAERFMKSF